MRISDWSSDVCSSDLDLRGRERDAGGACAFAQAGEQGCCARFETCIQRRIGQLAQDRQARAHRQRIAGQRAGLIDRAEWCELFHHRALAAERASAAGVAVTTTQIGSMLGRTAERPGGDEWVSWWRSRGQAVS